MVLPCRWKRQQLPCLLAVISFSLSLHCTERNRSKMMQQQQSVGMDGGGGVFHTLPPLWCCSFT
jgi:hypothetical protein